MLIFKTIAPLQKFLNQQKSAGLSVGFVPTMGALHLGHISLMEQARRENDVVVTSIFVNPTQFNEKADLDKYPITLEADIDKLVGAEVDVLFLPSVEEIYPDEASKKLDIDLGQLNYLLEAAARPGHFSGVATVVKRLLDIVQPDVIYMGQKDFQQHLVVTTLVKTFNIPVKVARCHIIREPDGLAMSSRNVHLKGDDREAARELSKELEIIRQQAASENLEYLKQQAIDRLNEHPLITVAYLETVDGSTLSPVKELTGASEVAVVAAVKVGGVHLLDNVIIS